MCDLNLGRQLRVSLQRIRPGVPLCSWGCGGLVRAEPGPQPPMRFLGDRPVLRATTLSEHWCFPLQVGVAGPWSLWQGGVHPSPSSSPHCMRQVAVFRP